jgi:hypothetical protein
MATSQERDDHVRVVEHELNTPKRSVPTPPAAPWQPVSGIVSAGGEAARRTIASKTHKA